MTETTNPGPGDPAGATTPNTGTTPASSGAQSMLDGGALEADGDEWGPLRQPKTDAADPGGDDPVSQPGRSVAAEDDDLAPQSDREPMTTSTGRGEGAAEGLGGATTTSGLGLGGGPGGDTGGRGDAAR
jgi:hypothetical protein